MGEALFFNEAMTEKHPNWEQAVRREAGLYSRSSDIRSEFARDYTRVLHSLAYRRLRHKTQVFFNTRNDHVCTRMEHVAHVESVSYTIANALGLNTELTRAIAMSHDLGHAPFGHTGEVILSKLSEKYIGEKFWHEKNGLRFVDKVELLEGPDRKCHNMDLTYAVRDGIISHCGELDVNGLKPRKEAVDLYAIEAPGQYEPYTWEGCIVKMSDKIAYLGRDIEDALTLGVIGLRDLKELYHLAGKISPDGVNTSVIMHDFIIDMVANSSPEAGIRLSEERSDFMNAVKDFNYRVIYRNHKLDYFIRYSGLVIESIFEALFEAYSGRETLRRLHSDIRQKPAFYNEFYKWLLKYCDLNGMAAQKDEYERFKNPKIYSDLSCEREYAQAILDFISGMTDSFAIQCFEELISF